ncbi:MAG: hypothetical protein KY396_06135 [Actinobacteria bacterium]|nr:hypothetical protein [Actinomycetota bacterium]
MAKKSRTKHSAGGAAGGLRGLGVAAWVGIGVVVALGAFLLAREQATGGGDAVDPPALGLPHTPDYHSLLVDAEDPERLLLGTHVGIYASDDGGKTWRFAGLEGKDAMHFAREDDGTIWVAGHDVLERSEDGGKTWDAVRPDGLPHLDIHAFAVGQGRKHLVYAALAGEGLYRSDDAGATFRLISKNVGPGVYALTVTKHGLLFAADAETGVQLNASGDGAEWTPVLEMAAAGLAHNWRKPPDFRLLAAGSALRLLKSDSGEWETVLEAEEGLGPVAFAPSDPDVAYAIAFDRTLYRSDDGGRTWKPRS